MPYLDVSAIGAIAANGATASSSWPISSAALIVELRQQIDAVAEKQRQLDAGVPGLLQYINERGLLSVCNKFELFIGHTSFTAHFIGGSRYLSISMSRNLRQLLGDVLMWAVESETASWSMIANRLLCKVAEDQGFDSRKASTPQAYQDPCSVDDMARQLSLAWKQLDEESRKVEEVKLLMEDQNMAMIPDAPPRSPTAPTEPAQKSPGLAERLKADMVKGAQLALADRATVGATQALAELLQRELGDGSPEFRARIGRMFETPLGRLVVSQLVGQGVAVGSEMLSGLTGLSVERVESIGESIRVAGTMRATGSAMDFLLGDLAAIGLAAIRGFEGAEVLPSPPKLLSSPNLSTNLDGMAEREKAKNG